MGNDDEFFYKKWVQAHEALSIEPDVDEIERLLALWSGPGRFHHGLDHLRHCLIVIDLMGEDESPVRRALISLAAFYHDAVYDVGAKDNEAQSAAMLISYAIKAGLAKVEMDHAAKLIIWTKNHWENRQDNRAWAIMNDADLAVLATSSEDYTKYAENVWKEYSALYSRKDFVTGRMAFLEGIMDKNTFMMPQAYELGSKFSRFVSKSNRQTITANEQAHTNIVDELAELRMELVKLELEELRA